jgi:hypothetical protein
MNPNALPTLEEEIEINLSSNNANLKAKIQLISLCYFKGMTNLKIFIMIIVR